MKAILLSALATLSCVLVQGQATPILAGDTAPGFYRATDVPVYTLHDAILDRYPAVTDQVHAIDLDGDGVNDLSVHSRYFEMPTSGPTQYWYPNWISALSMDSTVDVVAMEELTWIADTVHLGAPIGPASFWTNTNSMLLAQNTNNYSFRDTWKDQSDHYVGLRVRKASGDTLYGWLKVSVQGYHIVHVEEHACQSTNPRDTIISLYASVGDMDPLRAVSLFPNPFTERSTLRVGGPLNKASIAVYNALGQRVLRLNDIHGTELVLERGALLAGQYLLVLEQAGSTLATRRFVVLDE